jgi:hypothetical protein
LTLFDLASYSQAERQHVTRLPASKIWENKMSKTDFRHRAVLTGAVLAAGLIASSQATACTTDPLLGSICVTAGTYCASDYQEAAGQVLRTRDYQALYYVLGGARFGGKDPETFALPDLRATTPDKLKTCIAVRGSFPNHPD